MQDIDLEGLKSAADFIKQLITLSTGILALSITFIKDILKDNKVTISWSLKTAWFTYFLSILFGVFAVGAVTGNIFQYRCDSALFNCAQDFFKDKLPVYPSNVQLFALLQTLTFLIATVFLIVFGYQTLKAMVSQSKEKVMEGETIKSQESNSEA